MCISDWSSDVCASDLIVLAVSTKTMPNFKSVADLKGKKIGVTAPGSSTNIMSHFVLAKAGMKPSDVSIVGVGASQGAVGMGSGAGRARVRRYVEIREVARYVETK